MTIHVVIADDHPVVLAGVAAALQGVEGISIDAVFPGSTELVQHISHTWAGVVVTDYSMPGGEYGDGATLLAFLQRRFPQLKIVVLTGIENPVVLGGILDAGVKCVVSKTDAGHHLGYAILAADQGKGYISPEIAHAIAGVEQTDDPHPGLSRREAEVLRMVAEGLEVVEIANRIRRSRKTVSTQKISAMRKLNLEKDLDIFDYAIKHGLVPASQLARGVRRGDKED